MEAAVEGASRHNNAHIRPSESASMALYIGIRAARQAGARCDASQSILSSTAVYALGRMQTLRRSGRSWTMDPAAKLLGYSTAVASGRRRDLSMADNASVHADEHKWQVEARRTLLLM